VPHTLIREDETLSIIEDVVKEDCLTGKEGLEEIHSDVELVYKHPPSVQH